jgi:Flp pilus assembly protein TadG
VETTNVEEPAMPAPAWRARPERGASAVEFALVVPLLVMLLLGMTTVGMSINNAIGATDAVREGARFGATTSYSPLPTGVTSWTAAIQQKTVDAAAGSIDATSQVCVKLQKGTSTSILQSSCAFTSSEPANPTSLTATECVVKVWARVPVTINIGLASWDINVVRTSVARYERTCT